MKKSTTDIFSLRGKVIIITGGAGFLGLTYAEALGKMGAQVVIWDAKGQDDMNKAQLMLSKKGVKADVEIVDITSERSVAQAVRSVIKKYKAIDVLINNAALNPAVGSPDSASQFAPYEDYPIDLWEKELRVNLTGTMICTKLVSKQMITQRSGSIINVGSDVSVIAHDHRVYNDPSGKRFKSIAYSTTKSALLGFTRQWAARLGMHNVRINTFSPTGVETPAQNKDFVQRFGEMTMFGRMAKPQDYIGPIAFLSSDASQFMTGQNLIVDGGKTAW
jgi:NAD(P)-dependent dehydrogenase (short-subunit alcohol dehydrogenase family)